MRKHPWRIALALAAVGLGSCRVQQAPPVWEPAATRTVARHVQATVPGTRVVVLSTAGIGGAELPWGVRQSLTTGGTEVVPADPAQSGTALLIFESSARVNDDWIMETTLQGQLPDHGDELLVPPRAHWRVRCQQEDCDVVEVVPRP